MQDLRNFFYDTNLVRVVPGPDGEPWFVSSDVARVLGYSNPTGAVRDHCKGTSETLVPSGGGLQVTNIIPERDVYRLVMRSKLPAAEKFEEWVVGEVLPSIRKTGRYSVVSSPVQDLLTMPRTDMLAMALELSRERDALKTQAQQHQATIATLEPKAQALERISAGQGSMCVTDAAKALRVKPSYLFSWMHEHRWIYRRQSGSSWVAMQDRLDLGFLEQPLLTISHPDRPDRVREALKVTAKGLAHLGQLLSRAAS